MNLTKKQAFLAMFYYLDDVYNRTQSDDIGDICSDIQMLSNGKPADLAAWDDWEQAVEKALNTKIPE